MGAESSACKLHPAHVPLARDAVNSAAAVLLAQYGTGALISTEAGTCNTISGSIRFNAANPHAQFDVSFAIRKVLPCAAVSAHRDTIVFSCKTAPAADDA